ELHLDFHDLLGIVPGAAGIGHKDRLIETEDGDGNQIADEEVGFEEGKGECGEKYSQEDVEHAPLRVAGANFYDLLAVCNRSLFHSFQADVFLDELHRPISAGSDRLHGSAGKPIDNRAAANQAQHKGRVQQREVLFAFGQLVG